MFHHITVLHQEAVDGLDIKLGGIYVDCTLGGAGHSSLIASRISGGGRLIAIDQDDIALANAEERLAPYMEHVTLVKSNFRRLKEVLEELRIPRIDGVLFDLGVSSPQLDEAERGFSYNADAPLDMRMHRLICGWTVHNRCLHMKLSMNGQRKKLLQSCSNTAKRNSHAVLQKRL